MYILAFETCFGTCSVAVSNKDTILAQRTLTTPNQQTEKLLELIDQCLLEANLTIEQIDYMALTNGPGSFTGIRIGLACAIGIQLATQKSVIVLSSFEALYRASKHTSAVVAFLCSKDSYYCQKFINNIPQDMQIVNHADFSRYCVGLSILGNVPEGDNTMPQALQIALIAYTKLMQGETLQQKIEPLYIRQPDAYQSAKTNL